MNSLPPALEQLVVNTRRRILIVDDHEDSVEVLSLLLTSFGQEVIAVCDSSTALAVAENFLPQIIILDLDMPLVSGLELAAQIKGTSSLKNAALFALSGWSTQPVKTRCKDFGFDRFFAKPTPVEQILFAITEYN